MNGPKIRGIGPAKALELAKRGIVTKEDMMKEDVFPTLPLETRVYLTYKPLKRIPREMIIYVENVIKQALKPLKPFVGGSYSRGAENSGDIDVLVLDKWNWDHILEAIAELKPIIPYKLGPNRLETLIRCGRRYIKMDMFKTTPEEYMFAKVYVTGSGQFNIILRKQAKKKGYLLNQRGLFRLSNKRRMPVKNERELFKLCDVTYKKPADR